MNIADVKKQIIEKTIGTLYVFIGEEVAVQEVYSKKIAEAKSCAPKYVDTVSDAIKAPSASLFEESDKTVFICYEDTEFVKADIDPAKLVSLLKDRTLVLILSKVDKRSRFSTTYEPYIVSFDKLSEPLLVKYIRQQIDLPTDDCKQLVGLCESDYSRIMLEVDKIKHMQVLSEKSASDILNMLVADGTISQPPQDAIFDWVDAVLDGKPKLAFRLYEECQKIGEPTLRLLLVLYNNAKQLLQVQGCQEKNIAEVTGLSAWEIRNAQKHLGFYTNRELVAALELIHKMETGIKQGQIDEGYVIPYVMVAIIGG